MYLCICLCTRKMGVKSLTKINCSFDVSLMRRDVWRYESKHFGDISMDSSNQG